MDIKFLTRVQSRSLLYNQVINLAFYWRPRRSIVPAILMSGAVPMTLSHQIEPIHGPVTEEQAILIAKGVAQGWHEPNAEVVSTNKQSRSEFIDQLRAERAKVLIASTGGVWTIKLRGKFMPNRVPPSILLECSEMS